MTTPLHTVTIEWTPLGATDYTFRCLAPADSLCHAVYTCTCEEWQDGGVVDGAPWHIPYGGGDPDDVEAVRHFGVLDEAECGLRDWFENSDEAMRGSITFPVTAEWDGDMCLFHAGRDEAGAA